ncbi:RNA polymerase sigma factor [Paludisphaera mucosa]|uniref:Sigma-70 family RNA polymerase sigma factor n=1 Tax=Paludisphaera mucosa TaxID=3030827 RepID=A0ABT6FIJ3_9BACT|nr:sigma-70 family RNA polymerase sigma factor [Paludisphaera mucosa]MDG3007402.1 sigma-70 family RNA polymerase sigma factor [Paludisphaera mucosa]
MGSPPDDRTAAARGILPEVELVARARAGEVWAFGVLYERHYDRVLGYLYRQTLRVATAEELTSDTFYAALRGLGRFRGEAPFGLWLYRIATNQLRMNRRARRRHPEPEPLDLRAEESGRVRFSREPGREDPGAAREQAERFARVRRAIGRLGESYQDVLVLRYFEGLNNDQVAQVLGRRVGTVKSLVHRGLSQLRAALDDGDATGT